MALVCQPLVVPSPIGVDGVLPATLSLYVIYTLKPLSPVAPVIPSEPSSTINSQEVPLYKYTLLLSVSLYTQFNCGDDGGVADSPFHRIEIPLLPLLPLLPFIPSIVI